MSENNKIEKLIDSNLIKIEFGHPEFYEENKIHHVPIIVQLNGVINKRIIIITDWAEIMAIVETCD